MISADYFITNAIAHVLREAPRKLLLDDVKRKLCIVGLSSVMTAMLPFLKKLNVNLAFPEDLLSGSSAARQKEPLIPLEIVACIAAAG